MADEILSCTKNLDSDGSVVNYNIYYRLEDAGRPYFTHVIVLPETMVSPDDASEAVALGNVMAAEQKANWLAATATLQSVTSQSVSGVVGVVTLPDAQEG